MDPPAPPATLEPGTPAPQPQSALRLPPRSSTHPSALLQTTNSAPRTTSQVPRQSQSPVQAPQISSLATQSISKCPAAKLPAPCECRSPTYGAAPKTPALHKSPPPPAAAPVHQKN